METVKLFKKGEKVRIEVEVANRVFKGNEINYELKDPRTGKCFDYLFKSEQISMIPIEEKKTAKARATTKTTKVTKKTATLTKDKDTKEGE